MSPAAFCLAVPSALAGQDARAACTRRAALAGGAALAAGAASGVLAGRSVARSASARGLAAGAAAAAVPTLFPPEWPYSAGDFARYDEDDDAKYYAQPRRVTHIDGGCVSALRALCAAHVRRGNRVLDLCAGFASYLPEGARAAGLGMNRAEMEGNASLEEVVVQDLNRKDSAPFPFDAAAFDLVLCALSIDYLTRPVAVLREAARVLRPGGTLLVAFSDRVFAEKAVANWTAGSDADHIYDVAMYIHFAGGFDRCEAVDISPRNRAGSLLGDPLYVVMARRL